jgi:hypothetical protein
MRQPEVRCAADTMPLHGAQGQQSQGQASFTRLETDPGCERLTALEERDRLSDVVPSTDWLDGSPTSASTETQTHQHTTMLACRSDAKTHIHLLWRPDIEVDALHCLHVSSGHPSRSLRLDQTAAH